MAEKKPNDLSPKLSGIRSAANELFVPPLDIPIGQLVGGLAAYSNSFKRGYGDRVFGSDDKGIWLGAANFEDAPFRVDMQGNAALAAAILTGYLSKDGTNQALSGSIIVGGVVDGQIIVKDSAGNPIVVLDNTGILINNGKLTIKDNNDISIIDATGLVSTSNFLNNSIFNNSSNSTASTSAVDLPGSALPAFTLTRSTKLQISVSVYGANTNLGVDGSLINVLIKNGATLVANMPVTGVYSPAGIQASFSTFTFVVSFAAGTHNLKLQYYVIGTGTAQVFAYDFSTLQFGK